jgi:uncharacterized membrane protein
MIKSKKGAVLETLNLVGGVILTLLTISVIAIAVFLALTSLQNAGIFTTGSQSANQTANIINNITTGTTNFFAQIPTIMTILGVVALIGAVVLIIYYVSRIGGSKDGL